MVIHGMACACALCVPHRGGPVIVHGTCKGYAIVRVMCVGYASRQVVRRLVKYFLTFSASVIASLRHKAGTVGEETV